MLRLNSRFLALVLSFTSIGSATYAQQAFAATPVKTQTATAQTPAAADADKIDINTATADQLKGIKGVGDAYSKRIIAGRPYTAKNQLSTRGILPPATYNQIKDQIIAKAPKK